MNYLNDATRYAADLTEAAESGDFERYRNIQAQLAAETTSAMLNQAAQAEQGKQAAIAAVSKDVPGFREFHGSSDYQRIITENRTLGEAVLIAEQNPSVQDNLPEFYRIVFDVHVADQLKSMPQQQPPVAAKQLRTETSRAMATEEALFRAVEASKRVDLSRDNRKKIIAELEQRGVGDVEL